MKNFTQSILPTLLSFSLLSFSLLSFTMRIVSTLSRRSTFGLLAAISLVTLINSAAAQTGIIPTDPSVNRIDWAATSRGSSISGGTTNHGDWPLSRLLDERESDTSRYSILNISAGQSHIIDMGSVRSIHTLQLHLWDGDDRFFRYRVDSSLDGVNYSVLIDRTVGEFRGVQRSEFPLTEARYIKITGTHSSVNNSFHLINEILVIGDDSTTPEDVRELGVDARTNGGSTYAPGNMIRLHAGIYEVEHLSGAVSPFADDGQNGGKTWEGRFHISVPVSNKVYSFGFQQNRISRFATPAEAEASVRNQAFTIYLPVESDVFFWYPDSAPADNRGSHLLRVRQLSGPNDSLLSRVRDAMTRSVLWQQKEVAEWEAWVSDPASRNCFGCHIQTQASVGLNESSLKVAGLPISPSLENEFVDAYQRWQNPAGWVSPFHGGGLAVTQTSLWLWGVSSYHGAALDALTPALLNGLNWVIAQQQANGGWNADHNDGNGAKLYYDGVPSAAHTTGNIQALASALNALAEGGNFIPFEDVEINNNTITLLRNYGYKNDVRFTPVENVTAIKIVISDSFHSGGNFVLTELQNFGADQLRAIDSSTANFSQSGYPIAEAHNGVLTGTSDGWAYSPRSVRTTPAEGLFVFDEPVSLDRLRVTQVYEGLQLKQYRFEVTTDASPTFSSNFVPLNIQQVGRFEGDAGGLPPVFTQSLTRAARLLSGSGWNFSRNTRTAAQTVIGLHAALPFLEGADAQAALTKIQEVDAWLRLRQRSDGGWSDASDGSGISRVYYSAQALRALLIIGSGELDEASLRGSEYLLREQDTDGAWTSPPLARRLAATTWVEIALPTLFDRLNEAYRQSVIDDLMASGQLNSVELTWTPIPGAVSYNIYRRLASTQFQLIRQGHVTEVASYLDEGLVNEATYYYMVRWVNERGIESADSNEASGTPYGLQCGADSPPRITSRAITGATIGEEYRYQVEAEDPDPNDILSFSLTAAPNGMTIVQETGLITWTPTAPQEGSHFVRVKVEDRIGRFATQAFRIFAAPIFVNQAPGFVSTPVTEAVVGYPYVYRSRALDPNVSDIITYLFRESPSGMTINSTTGRVGWRPNESQTGSHPVGLQARDLGGLSDDQDYSIEVVGNQPPEITSTAPTRAPRNRVYVYSVTATDPERGVLSFFLDVAPAGMTINRQTGRIIWTPEEADIGEHPVTVSVRDPAGASDSEPFVLTVPTNEPPIITSAAVTLAGPSSGYSYQVRASDPEEGRLTYGLLEAPAGMTISAQGLIQWTTGGVGDYPVTVEVRDEAEDSATQPYVLLVREGAGGGGEVGAPSVEIESPTVGSELSVRSPVVASIVDTEPRAPFTWEFELRREGESEGLAVGSGAGEISSAEVGVIDPTTLANDAYNLWVHIDKGSRRYSSYFPYTVHSRLKWGVFETTVNDLTIPLTGVSIDISRYYSSIDTVPYEFGHGWRLKLPGRVVDSASESPIRAFTASTRVFVTRPDGRRAGFTFSPYLLHPLFPFWVPYFRPDAGVTDTLDVDNTVLFRVGGEFWELFGEFNPTRYYLTTRERIRYTIDERVPGDQGGLREIRDANRNTLTFSNGAISHSSGSVVSVGRDAAGRITSITDLRGAVTAYQYSPEGNLISRTNPLGQSVSYSYDAAHRLLTITDHQGVVQLTNEYDAAGRLIRQIDAVGNPLELISNPDTLTESVRDRRGNITTLRFDELGNIVSKTNALGQQEFYTYDANGNLLSSTDALGRVVAFAYDAQSRLIRYTDPLSRVTQLSYTGEGLVSRLTLPSGATRDFAYDSFGNILSETDFSGRQRTFSYSSGGLISRMRDGGGGETALSYDSLGRVTELVSPTAGRVNFEYDGNGNLVRRYGTVTAVDGTVESWEESYTLDSLGRVIQVHDEDGGDTLTEWNAQNRPVRFVDARGNETRFVYNDLGLLNEIVYPDGGRRVLTYDSEYNLIAERDPLGRLTEHEYDALNRRMRTVFPDGSEKVSRFDGAGNLIETIDELGRSKRREFGPLNELIAQIDALGNRLAFEYDAAGQLAATVDALGNRYTYQHDPDGRLLRTIFPNGAIETRSYDAAGRLVAVTNPLGLARAYAYDAGGRLISETDEAGGITRFDYDERGRVIREIDTVGGTTTYRYSRAGNLLRRGHPDASAETFVYDGSANLIEYRDPNNRLYRWAYDPMDRVRQATNPLGGITSYEYDLVGNRTRVTDPLGQSTTFVYNERDRMTRSTDASGGMKQFVLDAVGNKLQMTDRLGRTREFAYDAANRITAEEWLDGGSTVRSFDWQYDALGRRVSAVDGGTSQSTTYDALSRPTSVNLSANGTRPALNFSINYDLAGRPIEIADSANYRVTHEYDGRGLPTGYRLALSGAQLAQVTSTFDARGLVVSQQFRDGTGAEFLASGRAFDVRRREISRVYLRGGTPVLGLENTFNGTSEITRLTKNGVTSDLLYDGQGQLTSRVTSGGGSETFSYDANGNRVGGGYVVGPNNRILADALFDYTYDVEGNIVAKIRRSDGEQLLFSYDHLNRVVGAERRSSGGATLMQAQYRYDSDGNRVAKRVDGVEESYAYSPLLANVWADFDASGSRVRQFITGEQLDQLLMSIGSEGVRAFLSDRLNTVHSIADSTGAIIGERNYSAFGSTLAEVGNNSRFGFTGRELDSETGLYNLRARSYDPRLGRFISEDGLGLLPDEVNPYRYVGNSPFRATDPLGLAELAGQAIIQRSGPPAAILAAQNLATAERTIRIVGQLEQAVVNNRLAAEALARTVTYVEYFTVETSFRLGLTRSIRALFGISAAILLTGDEPGTQVIRHADGTEERITTIPVDETQTIGRRERRRDCDPNDPQPYVPNGGFKKHVPPNCGRLGKSCFDGEGEGIAWCLFAWSTGTESADRSSGRRRHACAPEGTKVGWDYQPDGTVRYKNCVICIVDSRCTFHGFPAGKNPHGF